MDYVVNSGNGNGCNNPAVIGLAYGVDGSRQLVSGNFPGPQAMPPVSGINNEVDIEEREARAFNESSACPLHVLRGPRSEFRGAACDFSIPRQGLPPPPIFSQLVRECPPIYFSGANGVPINLTIEGSVVRPEEEQQTDDEELYEVDTSDDRDDQGQEMYYVAGANDVFYAKSQDEHEAAVMDIGLHWSPYTDGDGQVPVITVDLPATRARIFRKAAKLIKKFCRKHKAMFPGADSPVPIDRLLLVSLEYYDGVWWTMVEAMFPPGPQ